jgi:iron(III) transport system ATP-binding protein
MVQIAIDAVTRRFPPQNRRAAETTAVDNVSLSIPSGSLFFLLGPSGCGKTTLLRMIAGFILPSSGRILFDDQDMSYVPPHRRDTGMVFQSYALWPHMTVADNVAFGLDVRKIKGDERTRRMEEALSLVQMAHLKDRKPNQLSGGQQQRVALARALATRPKCLLLDEPLSNLDAKLRLEMRAEIRRIVKQTGITTIYVTHDQKEALSMADGIAVMKQGKLQQTGTPTELYRHPVSKFVADFIGESNFISGQIESISNGTVVLKTDAGPILAVPPLKPEGLSAGKKVWAAFRPEAVRFSNGVGPTANRLSGKHVSSTYLGEIAEHVVELPGGQRIKGFEINPSHSTPTVGEALTATFAADNVMLVEDA